MIPNEEDPKQLEEFLQSSLSLLTPNRTANMKQLLFLSLLVLTMTLNSHTDLTNGEAGGYIAKALKPQCTPTTCLPENTKLSLLRARPPIAEEKGQQALRS